MKHFIPVLLVVSLLLAFSAVCFADSADTGRDWSALMPLPTAEEIAAWNASSTERGPYLTAWFPTGELGRFTQLAVDFKADYLPGGTYCCIACFTVDRPSLESQYERVSYDFDHYNAYAGFQRNMNPDRHNSILSFWSAYCYNAAGELTTVDVVQTAPAGQSVNPFYHEGRGTNSLVDYPWEAGKWYRALLQCGQSPETGNTTVEYWVQDIETSRWTQLGVFDLRVPGAAFKGNVAMFLEDFEPKTSGDIRTMEFRNFRVFCEDTREWKSIDTATFYDNANYSGSYQFGSDGETFWMISTGIPGLGATKPGTVFTAAHTEEGTPYQIQN